MNLPKIVVFASGTPRDGGSGFKLLVENSNSGALKAEIAAVVSNQPSGGVYANAVLLHVPFVYFPSPFRAAFYRDIVHEWKPDLICLSGWVKKVRGLNPRTTINIHPGPLPLTAGLYGRLVHEKVFAAFKSGEIKQSEVCMHFVTREYDKGPVFFRYPVPLVKGDTPQTIYKRVNAVERDFQALITNLVVTGEIRWNGRDHRTLALPRGYDFK